jgi:hypothetical protein
VREYDLFLSHNHNDSARVEILARTLTEKHGLHVWLDKLECGIGKLEPQCEAGIRNSRVTVVVVSQAALNSKWVDWEVRKHLEFHPDSDRLLPVKFEPLELPPHLGGNLWADFADATKDVENAATVARLIRSADAEDARRRRGFRAPARQGEHGPFPPSPKYGFQGFRLAIPKLPPPRRRFRLAIPRLPPPTGDSGWRSRSSHPPGGDSGWRSRASRPSAGDSGWRSRASRSSAKILSRRSRVSPTSAQILGQRS